MMNSAGTAAKCHVETGQWYQRDPALYQAEICAMRKELKQPDLQPNFMADGRMYWLVKCRPNIGPEFNTLEYALLLVYNEDFPSNRYGLPVKAYLIDPTVQQLQEALNKNAERPLKALPHTFRDASGQICLSLDCGEDINFFGVHSAVYALRRAGLWLCKFENFAQIPEEQRPTFFCF